jgi:hypothetical protein
MTKTVYALLLAAAIGGCDDRALPSGPAVPTPPTPTATQPPKVHERVILSPVYEVDRIYKSMTGPQSTEELRLEDLKEPELLWIVGFEATMREPDGNAEMSQDFMCHTNLDVDATAHMAMFPGEKRVSGRLFTLSQGQFRIDMPAGFGIPILSTEAVSLNTQVLNLNMKEGKAQVRHRVVMRYVRDKDLTGQIRPLYPAGAYGLKLLEGPDGFYGVDPKESAKESGGKPAHDHAAMGHSAMDHSGMDMSGEHGGSCLPGQAASSADFEDGHGRKFTGHWIVKPGREENHTIVTDIMDLKFDTTLHYVAVHLHPFAESIELRDVTTGKTVYKAHTKQAEKGIGLAQVDYFSSPEGLPLFKDHEYEIISMYNNTTGENQDSMAVMNLYLLDKEFKKPDLAAVKKQLDEKREKPAENPAREPDEASGKTPGKMM